MISYYYYYYHFFRSVSAPGSGKDGLLSLSSSSSVAEDEKDAKGLKVSVPKTDDETFTSFFNGGLSSEKNLRERLEINDEDLDLVTNINSSQL